MMKSIKKRKFGLFLVIALAAVVFTGITLFCLFGMKQREPDTEPDFSTKKLLVGVDSKKNLSAGGDVICAYGNTYLLSFDSEEETRNAYEEYKNSANFVDTDAYVYLEGSKGTPDDSQTLKEITEGGKNGSLNSIAMISTGITGEADKVSVIDDYTESETGTRLAMLIRKQNPKADLISVQAFNKEGTATSASLYAAIETAINKGAGTIVLPFSTTNLPGTAAVNAAIKDATEKGVTVIGAAGDKDIEALYTMPGSDESALVVGACNDNGKKLRSSNYGQSVDYNVVGGNTAEAAATMAGYVSKNGAVIDNKTVFSADGQAVKKADAGDKIGSLLDTDVDELSEGVSISGFTSDADLTDSVKDAAKQYAGIDADAAVSLPSSMEGQNFTMTGSRTGSNVIGLKLNGTESNGTGEITVTPTEIQNDGENSEVTFHVTADTKKGQAEGDYTFNTRHIKGGASVSIDAAETEKDVKDDKEITYNSDSDITTKSSSSVSSVSNTETTSSVSTSTSDSNENVASTSDSTDAKSIDSSDTQPSNTDVDGTGEDTTETEKLDTTNTKGRILVKAEDKAVTEELIKETRGEILGQYDDVYLIQYKTEKKAADAAETLSDSDQIHMDDAVFSIADNAEISDDVSDITAENNPLNALNHTDKGKSDDWTIALIDTGASGNNVVESVSMLGDDGKDENGHGTRMAKLITEENPNARILSIKALDKNGKGTPSSVYAAIQYAIEKKVRIINLSFSGAKQSGNAVIEEIIKEANKNGITVIGAAGNNGANVSGYLPGSLEVVQTIGAADTNGNKLESSNYGNLVDWWITAKSTSEAAAKASGIYSRDGHLQKNNEVFPSEHTDIKESDVSTSDSEGFEIADHNATYSRGTKSLSDYMGGMTRAEFVNYIDTHLNKYLGGGYAANQFCDGFVHNVMADAMAATGHRPTNAYNTIPAGWAQGGQAWGSFINRNPDLHVDTYRINPNAVAPDVSSWQLQKGDIIWFWTSAQYDGSYSGMYGSSASSAPWNSMANLHHIGVYWGTYTDPKTGKTYNNTWLHNSDSAHTQVVIGNPSGIKISIRPEGKTTSIQASVIRWSGNIDTYASLSKRSSNSRYTDGDSYYSLAGAVYYVYDGKGNRVATLTTDKNGNTSKIKLKPGTYTAIEQVAPHGFRLDDGRDANAGPSRTKHTLTIKAGQSATFISVEPYYKRGQIHLYKTDAVTGYELKGAEFTLYERNSSGGWDSRGLLHSKGNHFWTDVIHETQNNNKYGSEYKIVETKAPYAHRDKAGNINLTKESDSQFVKEFTLSGDVNQVVSQITANNKNTKVRIQITKLDEVHPETKVTGATLRLYPWNNQKNAFDESKAITLQETSTGVYECDFLTDTTNEGKIRIVEGHLSNGKLIQDKNELPVKYSGHVDQQHTISSASTQETYNWTCYNHIEPQHARIVMKKTDSETGSAIEGATFKVYEHDLKANKWVYYTTMVWNKATQQYELPEGTDLLGYYDSSDAAYTYYGHYNSGKYVVVEEKAPTGYVTEHPSDGFANPDTGVKYRYWDASFSNTETPKTVIQLSNLSAVNAPTSVYMQKVDANGNPMNDVVFRYGDANGDESTYKSVTSASMKVDTDADGKADTMMDGIIKIQRLTAGTWQIQETDVSKAQAYDKNHQGTKIGDPGGYHLDDTWNKFYVSSDGLLKSASSTLVRTNKIGNISVGKNGQKENGSTDTEWGNYLVFRMTNYAEYPLRLTKYAKLSEKLYTITADGYKQKTGETDYGANVLHDPSVKKDTYADITDDSVKAVLNSVVYTYNEDGSIKSQRPWTIGQKFPYGMKFSVYEYSKTSKSVDGNGYKTTPIAVLSYSEKAGMFVDEQTASGNNPKEVTINYTPDNQGKYMVKETATTAGYIRDASAKYVTLPAVPDQSQYNRLREVRFTNTTNEFSINKIDTSGNKVAGCQFRVWMDPLDGGSDNGEVILQTNDNNDCAMYALRPGTWHYQEVSVPHGFNVDDNIYDFTVSPDGTIEGKPYKKVTRVNTRQTLLRVLKEDTTEQYLNDFPDGTEFYIYEWDAEKGAFSSVPSKKLIYKRK